MTQQYTITPFTLVNDDQLIDAQVAARPLDDLRKHEVYVGTVTSVVTNKWGKFAYFKTPDLVGGKFIRLDRIVGYAHLPTPTPAAALADELPNVAIDVIVEQETVAAAQPAHMTDTGREVGELGYLNVKAGYGYIKQVGGSYRFDTRNVLGGTQAVIALMSLPKNAPLSFGVGEGLAAVNVCIPGHEKSESHYAFMVTRKAANAAAKQPAKDRAAARRSRYAADLAAQAAKDKADMIARAASILAGQA